MKLIENIARFERHLEGAIDLKGKDISDHLVYNTLAMECFQAVNALIEIGEHVVTKKKLGFPSTYREVFELLYKKRIVRNVELEALKRLIFLRNLISHEYYRITEDELLEAVLLPEKVKEFVARIKRGKESER